MLLFHLPDPQNNLFFCNFHQGYEELAMDGYLLLAERLRDETEKTVVQGTLEKYMKVQLNFRSLDEEVHQRLEMVLSSSEAHKSFGRLD